MKLFSSSLNHLILERLLHRLAAEDAGDLADYVAVAMIEVAVNQAIDVAGHEDIVTVLRDLADQIEQDIGAEEE